MLKYNILLSSRFTLIKNSLRTFSVGIPGSNTATTLDPDKDLDETSIYYKRILKKG